MRQNPGLNIETAITELAVGEALVSFLDEKGRPGITERVYVLPPGSQIGVIAPEQRQALIQSSIVAGVYEKTIDRESAYEKIKGRTEASMASESEAMQKGKEIAKEAGKEAVDAAGDEASGGWLGGLGNILGGGAKRTRASAGEQLIKSAASSIGREVGRQIIRGVLGGILGRRR
jgi:DNA helicase HerA-like ATPase